MTKEEFLNNARKEQSPSWRWGQTVFNYAILCEETRQAAEETRGTNFDPFHDDSKVDAFVDYLNRKNCFEDEEVDYSSYTPVETTPNEKSTEELKAELEATKEELMIFKAEHKVLLWFDFKKVHKIMEALNWKWAGAESKSGIPEEGELVDKAKRLLDEVCEKTIKTGKECERGCGGFEVSASMFNGELYCDLKFVVESSDNYNF